MNALNAAGPETKWAEAITPNSTKGNDAGDDGGQPGPAPGQPQADEEDHHGHAGHDDVH